MERTLLILEYCRMRDGQKEHRTWCEYATGLWKYCDCGLHDRYDELRWKLNLS